MRTPGASLLIALTLAACGGGDGDGERSDGRDPAAVEDVRRCLAGGEPRFDVQGPLTRAAGDDDAPDRTLVVAGGGASAYLGWYDDEARAERSASEQREHAKQFSGAVERRGPLTIIWLRGRESDGAARIKECALS